MKRQIALFLILTLVLSGCGKPAETPAVHTLPPEPTAETTFPPETTAAATLPPETVPETTAEPTVETTLPIVVALSPEDQELLLKIGMAELGKEKCPECVALVMCTVLNRVASKRFSSTVRGVIYAQDQFTPVWDGTFDAAKPNDTCYEALDMVIHGWDESQGALYYEFCQGESWHSRNLKLLTEHCNTRFYE